MSKPTSAGERSREFTPFSMHCLPLLLALVSAFLSSAFLSEQAQTQSQSAERAELCRTALNRLQSMTSLPLEEWRFHVADLPHPEDPALDDRDWRRLTLGEISTLPVTTEAAWYRSWIEIPARLGGKPVQGSRVHLALRVPSLARVFFNGSLAAEGSDRLFEPILVTENAVPGQRILVAIHTARLSSARLSIDYPGQADPWMLGREIQSIQALLAGLPNEERDRQLAHAVEAIDFAALDRGSPAAFEQSLEEANRRLQPLGKWMKQFTVRAVGNSHIDMAWLWPWTETVEIVRNTYSTALDLMREYPQFTYAQSSAQTNAWMEEKYPALFRQIQERVQQGRWEIVGGMWVEPDLNMPDGESLVRQLLLGKRYFLDKFGVDVKIGWNPDSFGYNWQLPQIYKRSGIDSFVTQKISWNDTTVFPYKLFWWQSPDGSRVLTYFPHDYDNPRVPDQGIDPVAMAADVAHYVPQTGFPEIMHLYGVGDHGGGPTRAMLDDIVTLQSSTVAFPQILFSTAQSFFHDLEQNVAQGSLNPPTWNDELYLEYHRGCYTTQSETKKLIRNSEELLQNAEKFASLVFLDQHSYPGGELEDSWKRVLFDEFHDIMPGSGIAVNYLDAARNLSEVRLLGEKVLSTALHRITERIETRGSGVPAVIFNPLAWPRTGPVEVEAQMPEPTRSLEVRDAAGQRLASQVTSSDAATNRVKVRVLMPSVPALGYEVIHLLPVTTAPSLSSTLRASRTMLENEFVKVKLDPRSGCVTSLVNKVDGRDAIAAGGCGNLLETFVDRPAKQDAWEIKFDEQSWDLKQPQSVELIESGPVRAVIRVKNKFQNSTFVQDICLYAGVPRVEVEMQVDWHEPHILLKVAVPVSVETDGATYEIPYGTIRRPTTRNSPAEQAKFEVPALRWGDLSDGNHGLSLLNGSKYGYDAKGNVIRLSLLRAPTYPGPQGQCCTDQGFHEFVYALYPHKDAWNQGGTMRQGYELNFPMMPVTTSPHRGSLPARHSFVQIEPDNVVLTAVKKAEDDDGVIFRFYEFAGRQSQVRLHLPGPAADAFETNLMEKRERVLTRSADDREIVIPTSPYQIKSVKIVFGKIKNP